MTVPRTILLVLYVVTFASFGWGMVWYFVRPQRPTRGTWTIRVGGPTGAVLQVAFLVLSRPLEYPQFAASAVLLMVGLALFWMAVSAGRATSLAWAFSQQGPNVVLDCGPYRFIRHPFYLSYICGWVGGAIGTFSIWGFVPVAVMSTVYITAARSEEVAFRASPLRDKYLSYMAATGAFTPRLRRGRPIPKCAVPRNQ
jgi:protein-S-isoprenylcysteine O-methyltransferase Ste14